MGTQYVRRQKWSRMRILWAKKHRCKLINTESRSQNTCEALQMYKEEASQKDNNMLCCFATSVQEEKVHFQAPPEKMGCGWSAQFTSCLTFLKLMFFGCGGCKGKGQPVVLQSFNWLPVRCTVFSYGDVVFSPSIVQLSLCYYLCYSCSSANQ